MCASAICGEFLCVFYLALILLNHKNPNSLNIYSLWTFLSWFTFSLVSHIPNATFIFFVLLLMLSATFSCIGEKRKPSNKKLSIFSHHYFGFYAAAAASCCPIWPVYTSIFPLHSLLPLAHFMSLIIWAYVSFCHWGKCVNRRRFLTRPFHIYASPSLIPRSLSLCLFL